MRSIRVSFVIASLLAVLFCGVSRTSAASSAASDPALSRLIALDGRLRSYTAHVHADIAMHTFPYLSPSLEGMYYHKHPSKDKLVFTSGVPLIAKQFGQVYPRVDSPSEWPDLYDISIEAQGGGFTTFKLVPHQHARVNHVDAKVNQTTGELVELRWNYDDGGYATLTQTYSRIGGYDVVSKQSGHMQIPYYNADVTSQYSDFKLNAPIPDSIFSD